MKKLILISVFVLTLVTVGCDESSTNGDGAFVPNTNKVGVYVADSADSITLPADVTVIGLDGNIETGMDIDVEDMFDYIDCVGNCPQSGTDEEAMTCMMGCLNELGSFPANGSFSVALTLKNSGSETETVTILAGTILAPDSSNYQPMMLIQDIVVDIAAGDTESIMLPVYCTDSSKSGPNATNCYTITDVTLNPCYLKILDILEAATKEIDDFSFTDALIVQTSIWGCADGLDPDADVELNNL